MLRTCPETQIQFEVCESDLEFYHKVSPVLGTRKYPIPPPKLCPDARVRRRLTWRNERTLYRRKCDLSGQQIVSTYSPESPLKVYSFELWFQDTWDPMAFGREIDFSRPFFEQFHQLLLSVPVRSLIHQQVNENCPYTSLVSGNKNCHYIFAASANENAFYSTYLQRCSDVSDCFFVFDCQLCYECIDCSKCYNLKFSQECENCFDSEFLVSCTSCNNCFGCVSLNREEFHILNKKYSKEDYFSMLFQIKSTPQSKQEFLESFNKLRGELPRKYFSGSNNENFSGDHIINCKNVFSCFDVTHLEDCKNCVWLHQAKDCHDCYAWGLKGELGYENHLCGNNFYHCIFCENCWNNVSNLIYCRDCYNGSKHLFGCVGLGRKEFCILNQQYSEKEYYELAGKLVEHMQDTGEWGEFFPQAISPYGYNETVAAEYFPLARERVLSLGWSWRDAELPGIYGKADLKGSELNVCASDVGPEICNQVIECALSKKNFRFTKAELELYKKLQIELPQLCFDSRYQQRFMRRNPRALRKIGCSKCSSEIYTAIPEAQSFKIYCEQCFRG